MTVTRNDIFGCPVSLSPTGDLAAWNACQMAFMAHGASTPVHLGTTLESDSHFALALACKGLFSGLLGRREMAQVAREAERAAREAMAARSITGREQAFVDALSLWNAGSPRGAADRLDAALRQRPHDALAMKLVQAIRFVLGDATGMRRSIEAALPALGPDHVAHGYALGCHAFTLEETGEYVAAERAGRAACGVAPDDAWGLHAVAHVHDMTNDIDAGMQWLTERPGAWDHCNNFRFHVWWHLALMHMDRGEYDAVLALYDRDIRADKTDDYRDISNAASLLSRLELEGVDIGKRWEELADLCENRTEDGCLAFADLHYMLALLGDDRPDAAARLVSRMRRDAVAQTNEIEAITKHPGLDTAQGLEAFAEGNHALAFRHLANAHGAFQSVGGSHAQRDVFERLTIEAGIRAGQHDMARLFLDGRTARRAGAKDAFARSRLATLDAAERVRASA